MGFNTAWVNRPSRLANSGLAPAVATQPSLEVADLARLAEKLITVGR
jgi:hypothetical protein